MSAPRAAPQVDTDDVTNAVVAALLSLDQEDAAARAG
jgi:hypothetical protein